MTMTIEEAKKMVGTEFTFVYEDDDTIQAYVKKFDPAIGLTAVSLTTKTDRDGWSPSTGSPGVEKDGTFCVIGIDVKYHNIEDALIRLTTIRDTGKWAAESNAGGLSVNCAF